MTKTTIYILLADDNMNEHVFFNHALRQIKRETQLKSLSGGIELLKHFEDKQASLPDILFLDINMPLKNGKECLQTLRSDDRYDHMPIVMYSTSDAESDIDETYTLGANLYVRKPNEMLELRTMLCKVLDVYEEKGLKRTDKAQFLFSLSS